MAERRARPCRSGWNLPGPRPLYRPGGLFDLVLAIRRALGSPDSRHRPCVSRESSPRAAGSQAQSAGLALPRRIPTQTLIPSPRGPRRSMEEQRVRITGGAGFIGSHLVDRLAGRNLVSVLDDLSTGSLQNLASAPGEVHVKKGSVLQPKVLSAAMKGRDVVYHLASKTSVPESVKKPQDYWRTNVEGTLNVLKAAVDAGARRVVFASSAAVYGNVEGTPTVETQKPAPASPYATTKMVGEFACEEIASLKGIETVVLRIFNVYGPRQPTTSSYASVIPTFCSAIAANRPIETHGDGQQNRDFLYIGDLAEALELAGDKVGSGIATSVADVATVLSEITNAPVRATRKEPRPGDVRHSQADIGKAAARLGFTPRTSLRDGMEKTLAYFRAAEAAR